MKGKESSLRKSVDIGHTFTEESIKKLRIGVKYFLLLKEKNRFREMIEGHGKAFAFSPNEIGCLDLYSGYEQFQLPLDSREITTMRTSIGVVRMCMLPQGATNSVAHMMNAMNKVLHDCIPEITMPFLEDIQMKGCAIERKG